MRAVLALVAALSLAWPAAAAQGPGCGAPAEWLESPPLRATATGIATGRLRILAVGSASVSGPGVTAPAAAWPARLRGAAARAPPRPCAELRGARMRGTTATDQWRMIEEALRAGPVDLVIWQAGMTEAVRGLPLDDMAAAMTRGLDRLHARGVDVIVMGIQFSRFLRANAEVDPYRDALRVLATNGHAGFFSRYDIMRAWAEAGTVDMERAQRDRRAAEIDKLNDCLARALGAYIRDGVAEARR